MRSNFDAPCTWHKEQAFAWLERGLQVGAIGSFYKDEPIWDFMQKRGQREIFVFDSHDFSAANANHVACENFEYE